MNNRIYEHNLAIRKANQFSTCYKRYKDAIDFVKSKKNCRETTLKAIIICEPFEIGELHECLNKKYDNRSSQIKTSTLNYKIP